MRDTIFGRITILYIEPYEISYKLIEEICKERGCFDLERACKGHEGLQKADELKPDLILLNMTLGDISGLEVLQELKKHPSTMVIPVIGITTDPTDSFRDQVKDSGAFACLRIPLDIVPLTTSIFEAVSGALIGA